MREAKGCLGKKRKNLDHLFYLSHPLLQRVKTVLAATHGPHSGHPVVE